METARLQIVDEREKLVPSRPNFTVSVANGRGRARAPRPRG